jgi:hypothetical protein
MSAELPGLERLLADAAERHYSRRRPRLWLPRPAVVAPLVVAAAVVVALAIAVFPLGSDEQAATPPRTSDDPAAPLADRYSVFARPEEHRRTVGVDVLESHRDYLDMTRGYSSWVLRETAEGQIVALAGTARNGDPTLCLWEADENGGTGACTGMAQLLSDRDPWVQTGFVAGTGYLFTALVPDDVTSLSIELKGGAAQEVPIENSLAEAITDRPVCQVSWTSSDGTGTSESGGGFGAAEPEMGEPVSGGC